MTSILESEYHPPVRPYSQAELKDKRKYLHSRFRLSDKYAKHGSCRHFYRVKENGKKFKDIKAGGDCNAGNCSVCWKLSRTPRKNNLKQRAFNLVNNYMEVFENEPETLTYENVELEHAFYVWLYHDFNNRKDDEQTPRTPRKNKTPRAESKYIKSHKERMNSDNSK